MSDVVELSIPVRADLVILARLTAATVASRAEFDVEEIEDLRLAVDELCVSLVEEGSDGRFGLEFTRHDDQIEVRCTYIPLTGAPVNGSFAPTEGNLSTLILDALVDEHGVDNDRGQRTAWLRKRRIQHES
jgi:hypothetical protein